MFYFKFHIGDYRQATMHLTNEEDLAYRRLLEMYYDSEGPIPTDIPWVSRRLRLDSQSVESVLNDFFTLTENGWINHRADQEIAEYYAWIEKQKVNGSKGGRPKKTHGLPTANPVPTQKKPNQKPLTINHKDKYPPESPRDERSTRIDPAMTFPEEWLEYCLKEKPYLDAAETFAKFKDYWVAKPGRDARKVDWFATWRNWVRSEKEQPRKTRFSQLEEWEIQLTAGAV